MSRAVQSLAGQRFGRLTVQWLDGVVNRHAYWACVCDCGEKRIVERSNLTLGRVVSCGCRKAESKVRKRAARKTPKARRKEIALHAIQTRWEKQKKKNARKSRGNRTNA